MPDPAPEAVRAFLVDRIGPSLVSLGRDPATLPDDFDLLGEGALDSLQFLGLIADLEEHLGREVDLGALDVEEIAKLGPLSRHVARAAAT